MPETRFQKTVFALITVLITVHGYVFYSLYVINGSALMNASGESSVISAINHLGGVYMFGRYLPIWSVVLVEFAFAFSLELLMGSPLSFRLASKAFDPRGTHPVVFETAVISATVFIMCPAMSLIAAFLYYPYYSGFNAFTLIANWIKLVCFNFPFALLSQIFFIQPIVRISFKLIFRKSLKKSENK